MGVVSMLKTQKIKKKRRKKRDIVDRICIVLYYESCETSFDHNAVT